LPPDCEAELCLEKQQLAISNWQLAFVLELQASILIPKEFKKQRYPLLAHAMPQRGQIPHPCTQKRATPARFGDPARRLTKARRIEVRDGMLEGEGACVSPTFLEL